MYGSAGAPVPRWDPDQYETSDLDVRQWIWDELRSDGQKTPDDSVWKHLLELRGTALRLWIWHGAKSNSRKEVLARFRAKWSEELLRTGDIPAPLDRLSVQEAMRKAWQKVARPYLDTLEEREHFTRQRIFICAVLEGADHAHHMARLLLPHWLHDEWIHACQDEGLDGDGCEGAPAPDGLWRSGPHMQDEANENVRG